MSIDLRRALATTLLLALAGCSAPPVRDGAPSARSEIDFARLPDAVPRAEPQSRYGNPPSYEVFGKRYYVKAADAGFVQRGVASWYGTKFHGRRTSSGEPYDMYKMTAAHKTLPLPSYVRVTRLATGDSVVVRVNDRGPFHEGRIIDLSYAAARKLGFTADGTAEVEIRLIDPAEGERPLTAQSPAAPAPESLAAAPTVSPAGVSARPAVLAAAGTRAAIEPLTMEPLTMEPLDVQAAAPGAEGPPTAAATLEGVIFLQVGAFSDRNNAEQLRTRLAESISPVVIEPSEAHQAAALYRVRVGPLPSVEEADAVAARLSEMGIGSPRLIHH